MRQKWPLPSELVLSWCRGAKTWRGEFEKFEIVYQMFGAGGRRARARTMRIAKSVCTAASQGLSVQLQQVDTAQNS